MPLEIAVGQQRLVINQGYGFMVSEQDGQISWPTDQGLYYADTRLISSWRIFANGEKWDLLNAGAITYYSARIYLANRAMRTERGDVPAGVIGLVVSRCLAGGVHEDLDMVNNSQETVEFNLEIAVRADFADLFEVKESRIVRRGRIAGIWNQRSRKLVATYENDGFKRGLTISVKRAGSKPVYANGRISFDITLEPGESWHACLIYDIFDGNEKVSAPAPCIDKALTSRAAKRLRDWQGQALKIRTSNEEFYRFYRQSVDDLAALRLPIEGTSHTEFVPAAGVPWFVGLFGRDS
ncbi:MAG TPA: glycogen debranching N-terminal domain-containing protein, partial [Caulobacteraceae bacterium]|nr:glycogen debranching N-terminal domain-containing protein [Caulobacteraceae bacterium]